MANCYSSGNRELEQAAAPLALQALRWIAAGYPGSGMIRSAGKWQVKVLPLPTRLLISSSAS